MKKRQVLSEVRPRHIRGFTLIELLVVISIFGLLSSVVLAAATSAKKSSNDATIIQELIQFRNLYELTYSTTGSYSLLQTTTISLPCNRFYITGPIAVGFYCQMTTINECDNVFGSIPDGIIANNPTADAICKNIVKNSGYFYIGVNTNTNMSQKYSIAAYLPKRNAHMCIGSGNINSIVQSVNYSFTINATQDTLPGCSANP